MRLFDVRVYREKSICIKIDQTSKSSIATAAPRRDGRNLPKDMKSEVWSLKPEKTMTKAYLDIFSRAIDAQMRPMIYKLFQDSKLGK